MGIFSNRRPSNDDGMKSQGLASSPVERAAALVEVNATEGPMPETVDQFRRIQSSGGRAVVISLVNCQAVDDYELLELVEGEIHNLASECGLVVTSINRT